VVEEYAGQQAGGPSAARRVAGRAELWTSLLSFARVNLAMSKAEFMQCTPRYFDALVTRFEDGLRRSESLQEVLAGQLIAMVANTGFRSFEDPRKASEFMPSEWRKVEIETPTPTVRKRRTRKAIADEVRATFGAFVR